MGGGRIGGGRNGEGAGTGREQEWGGRQGGWDGIVIKNESIAGTDRKGYLIY